MRKGNLLLCGIVAVAMLAPSCQAIAPDVEYKRLPDWNCLEGLESYTEENGAIVQFYMWAVIGNVILQTNGGNYL